MSGPYSRANRRAALTGFGYLALVGGPLALLMAVVMGLGIWPPVDDGAVDVAASAPAGDSLEIDEFDPIVVWGVPADVDLTDVVCAEEDGPVAVDGAPDADGPAQRPNSEGATMTRLLVSEYDEMISCSGGGLTEFGYEVLDGPDRGQGALFFGIWGVIITVAGLLARRLTREPTGRREDG